MTPATVLITGGSRGVGFALAAVWLRRGCRVLITGRDGHRLAAAAESLRRAWGTQADVQVFAGDLAMPSERERCVALVQECWGCLDVLVNNAAVQHEHDLAGTEPAESVALAEQEIATNLTAPIALTLRFLPLMRDAAVSRGQAAVVNITSGLALAPRAKAPVYCATKAGLHTLTLALRWQLQRSMPAVRVVEAMLPLVDTEMTAGRGRGKLSPDAVAHAILHGLDAGRTFIPVGKVRLLRALMRVAPSAAERLLRGS